MDKLTASPDFTFRDRKVKPGGQAGEFHERNHFIPTTWSGPTGRTKGPINLDRLANPDVRRRDKQPGQRRRPTSGRRVEVLYWSSPKRGLEVCTSAPLGHLSPFTVRQRAGGASRVVHEVRPSPGRILTFSLFQVLVRGRARTVTNGAVVGISTGRLALRVSSSMTLLMIGVMSGSVVRSNNVLTAS